MAIGMVLRGTGIMQERVPTLSGDMTLRDLCDTVDYVANLISFEGWIAEVERYARKILVEAGHDPEQPGWIPSPVDDGSTLATAHLVLRWIRIARSEIKEGNAAQAAYSGIRIGCLVREHDLQSRVGRCGLAWASLHCGPQGSKNRRPCTRDRRCARGTGTEGKYQRDTRSRAGADDHCAGDR